METNNPLIYIVLPIYNGEKYFLEQLMSIYHQNYKKWYLIIVNDGSTDNSEKIAKKFISDYDLKQKVRIIYKKNGGLNSAITKGLEEIKKLCDTKNTNELICYCDCDDVRTREKLETQAKYMIDNPDIGVSYHDVAIINENTVITKFSMLKTLLSREDNFLHVATFGTHVRATEMMFKPQYIDLILPMPTGYRMYQDTRSMYIFYLNKIKIGYINKLLGWYRQGHSSLLKIDLEKENKRIKEWPQKKYFEELSRRYPEKKQLFEYVINYNMDRQINWTVKNYSLPHIYMLMLLKYPKIFIDGTRTLLTKFIKYGSIR